MVTLVRVRLAEEAGLKNYLEVLVPEGDWDALFKHETTQGLYFGMGTRPFYDSRDGYKKAVRDDFKNAREAINEYLIRGVLTLGSRSFDDGALSTLSDRFYLRRSWGDRVLEAAHLVTLVPVTHQTTRDIGMSAGIFTLKAGTELPIIVLTSTFSATLLRIFQLVVRRTFIRISDDGLLLRSDIYDIPTLQRHSRMIFHLLGIWFVGEPYPTPEIDDETKDMTFGYGELEKMGEGHAILWLKAGWCLFEALHEFSHVLMGDWLRPSETWTLEDEVHADWFAICCLLLEEEPTKKAWMLQGAIQFLAFLQLAEVAYGKSGHHPGGSQRAAMLLKYVRKVLKDKELRLFDFLSAMLVLPMFGNIPSDFGARSNDRFGT